MDDAGCLQNAGSVPMAPLYIQKYEDGVWLMAADMEINALLLEKNCTFITPFTY